MSERGIEIAALGPVEAEAFVRECELTGRRTIFLRNGNPVAMLIAHDEYLALRETVACLADEEIVEAIRAADDEIGAGTLLRMEELRDE